MNSPKVRPTDSVSLTFMAITPGMPASVRLKEHTLRFRGDDAFPSTVTTAAYGTHSKQQVLAIAAAFNKENELKKRPDRAWLVDTLYRIENLLENSRPLTTAESLAKNGWLHMDRLAADFRDELKYEWLEWLQGERGSTAVKRLDGKALAEVALEHPQFIAKLFARRSPRLVGIVHPVRPTLAPETVVWVATVRYETERFLQANARFLPVPVET